MKHNHYTTLLTAALCMALPAQANDEATDSTITHHDIEEVVIVHSPKESGKLRQQPMAVSIFSQAELKATQTQSLKALSALVPNFYMPDYGSSLTSAAYIRGVGSRINTPAMALYVDDVAYADKSAYDIELCDAERIDVLRGPQSTLYGRNAMGGLLSVHTRNPLTYEGTDVTLGATVKDHGYKASASHYHQLAHHVGLGVSAYYRQAEGFYYNPERQEAADSKEAAGGRMRLVWQPCTAWTLDLTTDYSYREEHGYPYRYMGAANAEDEQMAYNLGRIVYNSSSYYRRSLYNAALNAGYKAARWQMTSVTAYQNLVDNMTMDQDFTPADYFTLSQRQRINSWSEELTFRSRTNHKWQWTAGAYLMRQDARIKSPVQLSQTFMNATLQQANQAMASAHMSIGLQMHSPWLLTTGAFDTPVTDAAIFHQSTFNDLLGVSGLSLTAGLRLEYEKMRLSPAYGGTLQYDVVLQSPMMPLQLPGLQDQVWFDHQLEHDYLECLPKVSLQYAITPTARVYASWSKGYRSGGYNVQMFSDLVQGKLQSSMMETLKTEVTTTLSQPQFARMPERVKQTIISKIPAHTFTGTEAQTRYKPEYSYNYEVGTHLDLLEGQLQVDAAAFYMDIHDQQISRFAGSGLGRTMVNAGRGQSCGAELSVRGKALSDRLSLTANYGFTHATFRRYESGDELADGSTADYRGNHVPFVPTHTMSATAQWRQPVQGATLRAWYAGADVQGAGRIYWTEDNRYSQPFYAVLGVHAGLDFGAISLTLWGKNLTDTRYDSFFFTSSATLQELKFAQRAHPLQLGVDVRLHF